MVKSSKAFAPANISCIFQIYEHKNPRWMGSYGAGFTLNRGVFARVSKSAKTIVLFNGKNISFPTVKSTIKKLTKEKLRISIKSKLPLGCGFGLSGACALAAAIAANKLLRLKKTQKELAAAAHTAEVENKTGLGDVVNQLHGGFCVKLAPSSYFKVQKLPINNVNVYCRHFGKLSTKSIITSRKLAHNINKSAAEGLKKLKKLMESGAQINLSDMIKLSKEFAAESGLLKDKKTAETIKGIEQDNGNASMIMLGNAVFSDKKFKGSIRLKISDAGAHVL